MSFTALSAKYLGKTVFGYTLGSIFGYIKWILLLSIISFVLYKGYDFYNHYNNLTKTVTEQQANIKTLKDTVSGLENANEQLKKTNDLQEKSGKVSSDTVGNLANQNEKTNQSFDNIKEKVKSDVAAVRAKPVKKVKKPDSKEEIEVNMTEGEITESVSKVRITAIWRSYCSSNKPDESSAQSCKEVLL